MKKKVFIELINGDHRRVLKSLPEKTTPNDAKEIAEELREKYPASRGIISYGLYCVNIFGMRDFSRYKLYGVIE